MSSIILIAKIFTKKNLRNFKFSFFSKERLNITVDEAANNVTIITITGKENYNFHG